jgi:hypothetical protein
MTERSCLNRKEKDDLNNWLRENEEFIRKNRDARCRTRYFEDTGIFVSKDVFRAHRRDILGIERRLPNGHGKPKVRKTATREDVVNLANSHAALIVRVTSAEQNLASLREQANQQATRILHLERDSAEMRRELTELRRSLAARAPGLFGVGDLVGAVG